MKIIKITKYGIEPVTAFVTKGNKRDSKYFNISHGSVGDKLWMWTASLSYRFFQPKSDTDRLELTGDNFFIRPIRVDGKNKVDKKGNLRYTVTLDDMASHRNDVLVLWELPISNYKTIEYCLEGMVSLIGEGFIGRERATNSVITPAPIVEVTGDCSICWEGVTPDGVLHNQTIKYNHTTKNWDIPPVKIIKDSDD